MKKRIKPDRVSSAHDKAYDLSISDEVDLSEVLDELVRTYEKPDTVVSFLKMHDDDFDDIFAHSLNGMRIFMLDFITRCSPKSIDYVVKKLDSIDFAVAMTCCWQVLSLYADVNSYTKMAFKRACAVMQARSSLRHPYSYLCINEVKEVDVMLFETVAGGGRANEIATCINSLDISVWKSFTVDMRKSLFFIQLIQSDILEMLDEDHLNMLLLHIDVFMKSIMMQWLNADLSIAHKEFLCKRLCLEGATYDEAMSTPWSAIKKTFSKAWCKRYYNEDDPVMASSFEEMLLKITINGNISKRDIAYELMQIGRIDFLIEWMKFDAADLDAALRISDVVQRAEAEMTEEKHIKRDAKRHKLQNAI